MTYAAPKPPCIEADWRTLRKLNAVDLADLGLRAFNQRGKRYDLPFGDKVLMLFPAEWFKHIPVSFHVVDVMGTKTAFNANTHSKDTCVGYLAYGLLV